MLDYAGGVPFAGGIARKLTGYAGYEAFARFSADGDAVYRLRIKNMEKQPSLMLFDLAGLKEKDILPVPPFPIKK